MESKRVRRGLTPAQKNFADQWLLHHNGARAYRAAYPSVKKDETAWTNASRTLRIAKVGAYIKSKQDELSAKYDITQEKILQEESCIAFSNLAELFKDGVLLTPDKLPKPLQRALSSIEVQDFPDGSRKYKYRLWDKGRSLERLSKHLGLYEKDNQQKGPSLQEVFSSIADYNPDLAKAIKARLEEHASGQTTKQQPEQSLVRK